MLHPPCTERESEVIIAPIIISAIYIEILEGTALLVQHYI